jgi:GAF domain-containing protein
MIEINKLADVFVEVADTLVAGFDLIDFLHTLAQHTADVTGGAVGLVLADENGGLDLEEGPCLDCFRSGQPVVNTALDEASARWPRFAEHAVAEGAHSVHAFPMRLRDRVIGALNVFGTGTEPLVADEIRVVQAMADVATISIIQEQAIARAEVVTEQLQAALNSRVVIEQAKGAVARALGITVDEAFTLMRGRARRDRVPLTTFAHDLVNAPGTIERLGSDS